MGYRSAIGAGFNPRQVPTQPVRLDTTQNLAARLGDFVIFGTGQNVAAPAYAPSAVGTAKIVSSSLGPAGFTPGTVTDYFSVPQRTNLVSGDFGVSLRFQPISVGGLFSSLWDKGAGSRELAVFVDTSLNLSYEAMGNTLGSTVAVTTGMSFGNTYEVTLTRSGSTNTCYINGSAVGTFTDAGTGALPGPTAFGANISGGGNNVSANFIRWATWQNYCPTATDAAQLSAEPFGLLRPIVRRQNYTASGVAPPTVSLDMWHQPASQPYRVRAEMIPY